MHLNSLSTPLIADIRKDWHPYIAFPFTFLLWGICFHKSHLLSFSFSSNSIITSLSSLLRSHRPYKQLNHTLNICMSHSPPLDFCEEFFTKNIFPCLDSACLWYFNWVKYCYFPSPAQALDSDLGINITCYWQSPDTISFNHPNIPCVVDLDNLVLQMSAFSMQKVTQRKSNE